MGAFSGHLLEPSLIWSRGYRMEPFRLVYGTDFKQCLSNVPKCVFQKAQRPGGITSTPTSRHGGVRWGCELCDIEAMGGACGAFSDARDGHRVRRKVCDRRTLFREGAVDSAWTFEF